MVCLLGVLQRCFTVPYSQTLMLPILSVVHGNKAALVSAETKAAAWSHWDSPMDDPFHGHFLPLNNSPGHVENLGGIRDEGRDSLTRTCKKMCTLAES